MTLLRPEEIKIETLPEWPKGGQYTGHRTTGVRITHLLTNAVVEVHSERSQFANRAAAIRMLEFYLTDPENK